MRMFQYTIPRLHVLIDIEICVGGQRSAYWIMERDQENPMRKMIAVVLGLVVLGVLLPTVALNANEPDVTVRIVARKLADGRVEFGLRQEQADGTYGDEILPRSRFFPADAEVGRWLRSSPVDLVDTTPPDTAADAVTRCEDDGTHVHVWWTFTLQASADAVSFDVYLLDEDDRILESSFWAGYDLDAGQHQARDRLLVLDDLPSVFWCEVIPR